ncbi:MAG: hypothetical protein AB4057_22130 [Crocosphaera sp.]
MTIKTAMTKPDIRIKNKTYCELLAYLEGKANSDQQAKYLVEQLKTSAKPYYQLPSGSYILDGNNQGKYRVN